MLTIGDRGGKPFRITDEQRSRHMHVIGASGTGKSKFLEHLIRQDLLAGRGLCLLDPHGTLADDIVQFCASRNIEKYRRVHIIEPGDTEWCVGFNPLRLNDGTDPMLRVDTMVAACAEVWGGENIDETPLLATCLQLIFYALAVQNLTLVEAIELTQASDPEGFRATLTGKLPDYVFQSYWKDIRGLSRKDFEDRFSSTRRRLLRFLGTPMVRRVVGQRQRVLDLRRIMDDGDILIVNLAEKDGLSATSARLLGAMLASEFFLAAKGRPAELARRHPFYLYIDECYDFLTGDIERMLDQTRKFGLHLVLAHHRLAQLRNRSDAVYSGVMAGAQTKIVFGGLMDEDADIMAREIMRDSFNLERPKHILDKPTVVGDELIWLESVGTGESTTRGFGTAEVSSWSEQAGSSAMTGESYSVLAGYDPLQTGMQLAAGTSMGSGTGGASSVSEFYGRTTSSTRGVHQALRSRYEVRPTQVHSLEEEVHLAIVKLREQKNRSSIVKLRGEKAKGTIVPDVVPSLASPARIAEFRDIARSRSEYLSSSNLAEAEIAARHAGLGFGGQKKPPGDEEFWTRE
jgi:hypothetical protein